MRRVPKTVWDLIEPVLESMTYEFVGAELGQTENGNTLRVYIDSDKGIDVEDCAMVSRQLGALFDVEDPVAGEYNLEVSSPGLNRPLFSAEQFQQQTGEQVKIKLQRSVNNRRNFKGRLASVGSSAESVADVASDENDFVVLEIDGEQHQLNIADIESARLVYDFGSDRQPSHRSGQSTDGSSGE